MTNILLSLSTLVAALAPVRAAAQTAPAALQRHTLVIGANLGGADRPMLRYAVSDAERIATVIVDEWRQPTSARRPQNEVRQEADSDSPPSSSVRI